MINDSLYYVNQCFLKIHKFQNYSQIFGSGPPY